MREIESCTLYECSITPEGYALGIDHIKYKTNMDMKVAFSGSSGSGKTTLVKWVAEKFGLQHISGSAGDVKTEGDKLMLDNLFDYPGGGHSGVIKYSALHPQYGFTNQKLLQIRRQQIIEKNINFVTDRSPVDNMTYMVNQCGFHAEVDDQMCKAFFEDCVEAFSQLTHLIFVKAVQPEAVENNGSRIHNKYYQWSVDCQFELWLKKMTMATIDAPKILVIDFWDLEKRYEVVGEFLTNEG